MLKLENVSKSYITKEKKVEVLKNISYEFKKNKVYCIIGKSGAGKSTLIEILGLLLDYDTGKIFINDKDVKAKTENEKARIRNKEIGFIFQSYYLNPFMKAYENVMLPMYLNKKMTKKEMKEKAYKLLKLVGLENRETHFPKELSGGEQQRVAIARALSKNSDVLICDEPTGALDSENSKRILLLLEELARQDKKTIVIVTHNNEIKKIADRVYTMKNGKIIDERKNENPLTVKEIDW